MRDIAVSIAKEAGELLLRHYGKMQKLEYKLKTNFKTEVDDLSDALIRKRIKENFPEHNIYSEEEKAIDNKSEYSWVIDPLDGTLPYTLGISDHFAVSIALAKDKKPILGVIYAPLRDELYIAEEGLGTICNYQEIKVAPNDNINKTLLGMDLGKTERTNILGIYKKLISDDGITYPVSYACASVALSLVASGKLNAYLSLKLEPWDMAAAVVINREAGAKVTNIEGKEWELGDESILVANPSLHKNLMEYLK